MRILYGSVILLILFHNAIAQKDLRPGYIITLEMDTVKGLVNYAPGSIKECEFQVQESSAVQIYDPETINGFGYFEEDQYFHSFSLPSPDSKPVKIFAEILLRGKASLFLYEDFFYLQKDTVRERIEKVQMREANQANGRYVYAHKTYIGTLNRYFSDCLPAKLLKGDVSYTEKDFVEVFRKYSECSNVDYHAYKTPRQKRMIIYQVLAGFNNSSIKFPNRETDIFNSDNNFFIGGGLIIPLLLIGNRIFLTAELAYHRNKYRGKKEGYTVASAIQKDYIMDVRVIKLPVGIKLNLGEGLVTPYLKGGLTPFLPLKTKWIIGYQGHSEIEYDVKEKTASLVFWGGIGFQRKINARQALFLDFRMEKLIDYIGFYGPNGATNIPSSVLNKMLVFGFNF
ncbi:MAG: hypothetical protein WD824_08325 [Cyclobacteriaceae bacterium]